MVRVLISGRFRCVCVRESSGLVILYDLGSVLLVISVLKLLYTDLWGHCVAIGSSGDLISSSELFMMVPAIQLYTFSSKGIHFYHVLHSEDQCVHIKAVLRFINVRLCREGIYGYVWRIEVESARIYSVVWSQFTWRLFNAQHCCGKGGVSGLHSWSREAYLVYIEMKR